MGTKAHSLVSVASRHPIVQLSYPDATDRAAGTNETNGITAGANNIHSVALQIDNGTFWLLLSAGPLVWQQVAMGGATSFNPTSVLFAGASGEITEDGADFVYASGVVTLGGSSTIGTISGKTLTLLPDTGGITQVGDAGSTSHTLAANDDLFVSGKLEVDGVLYADGALTITGLTTIKSVAVGGNEVIYTPVGNGGRLMIANAYQTVDCMAMGMDAGNNYMLFCQVADMTYDFAHTLQTDPTLFIHSANQAANEWISFTHDQTDGVISVGTGAVKVANLSSTGLALFTGAVALPDAVPLRFGNSYDATMTYNSVQTNHTVTLGVGADSNSFLVVQQGDVAYDFSHTQQTDPTIFIHSANQATDEWVSLTHNQTNAVINTGTGALQLSCNSIFAGSSRHTDAAGAYFGSTDDALIGFSTSQTAPTLQIGVGTESNALVICQQGDFGYDKAHAARTNPSLIIQSANQTADEWILSEHDQTDRKDVIGKGSQKTEHETPVELADDAEFGLPDATAGLGFFQAGDGEEYAQVSWTSAGVVTLIASSANVANTDSDTDFCIYDGGTQVMVKNRLGSAKKVIFTIDYWTP